MEHRLVVGHDRLDLDHEDLPGHPMTPEYVDGASFARDRERNLDRDVPVVRGQELDDSLDQARVGRVEQPIQALGVPAEADVESRVERDCNPGQGRQRYSAGASALDVRNDRSTDRGAPREVDLTPPATNAQGTIREPEADLVHTCRMRAGAALAVTSPSTIAQR